MHMINMSSTATQGIPGPSYMDQVLLMKDLSMELAHCFRSSFPNRGKGVNMNHTIMSHLNNSPPNMRPHMEPLQCVFLILSPCITSAIRCDKPSV